MKKYWFNISSKLSSKIPTFFMDEHMDELFFEGLLSLTKTWFYLKIKLETSKKSIYVEVISSILFGYV